jgi:hypothetical protein
MTGLLDIENGFDVTAVFDFALGGTKIRMATYYHSITSTPPAASISRGVSVSATWGRYWLENDVADHP